MDLKQGNQRTQFSGATWRVTVNNLLHRMLQAPICICENMTSSTKPKVHNVLHCRQRTEPRPHVTCTENFLIFGLAFLRYASGQTDRQTDRPTDPQTVAPKPLGTGGHVPTHFSLTEGTEGHKRGHAGCLSEVMLQIWESD